MTRPPAIMAVERVEAPWQGTALVCGRCSKKLGGGFGAKGKHKLAKALRQELKDQGRRRALRVVEVGCLGLCPRHAVTVAGSADPGAVFVVGAGTDPAEVARLLAPETATPAPEGPA